MGENDYLNDPEKKARHELINPLLDKAIRLLNSECPQKSCDWCEGR